MLTTLWSLRLSSSNTGVQVAMQVGVPGRHAYVHEERDGIPETALNRSTGIFITKGKESMLVTKIPSESVYGKKQISIKSGGENGMKIEYCV